MTFIPDDAPFSGEQRAWLDGFMAALRLHGGAATTRDERPVLHVLYGSQTGNCLALAEDLAEAAGAAGLLGRITALDDVEPSELATMGLLTVITSTYGEGEMPDNAELFWQALAASDIGLDGVSYGVLALGDTGYDGFCAAGRLIDERLAALGAQRVVDRVDCDVDFDEPAATWIAAATDRFVELSGACTDVASAPAPSRQKSAWNRKNPFPAALVANRLLSAPGSAKEIRHIEIGLGDSGLTYEAGDALAVVPVNDPVLVDALLAALGAEAGEVVDGADLGGLLTDRLEISTPSRDLVAAVAERSRDTELQHVIDGGDPEAMAAWLWGRDVLDLVTMCEERFSPAELVGLLRPLQHRAYSISSSSLSHPDTVHLTVATVRHHRDGRDRGGVASTFLADRADGEVRVFVQSNAAFRVAPDDAPMIMIGPGTGVAPFRAFCQERQARGAGGRTWLFFGDQHRDTDFIYADELLGWQESGVLDRLDLAFSRDQEHKVYVQTRMREQGKELFSWLEDGAHVYVCGDATRMARDVDEAFHDVVAEHGGLDADAAEDYIAALRRAKRYVRDVY